MCRARTLSAAASSAISCGRCSSSPGPALVPHQSRRIIERCLPTCACSCAKHERPSTPGPACLPHWPGWSSDTGGPCSRTEWELSSQPAAAAAFSAAAFPGASAVSCRRCTAGSGPACVSYQPSACIWPSTGAITEPAYIPHRSRGCTCPTTWPGTRTQCWRWSAAASIASA